MIFGDNTKVWVERFLLNKKLNKNILYKENDWSNKIWNKNKFLVWNIFYHVWKYFLPRYSKFIMGKKRNSTNELKKVKKLC